MNCPVCRTVEVMFFGTADDEQVDLFICPDCQLEWADWELRDFWAVFGSTCDEETQPIFVDEVDTLLLGDLTGEG